MHRDGQLGLGELLQRLAVEIHERAKAHRAAADDRERQRQPITSRARHRVGAAPYSDPCLERSVLDRRIDSRAGQRRACRAAPRHRPSLQQRRKQRQLVLEQLLVAGQVVSEQRIGLGKRAAAENDFGAAIRQRVEGREPLEHTHGIVGAQDRHGRSEEDPAGPRGDRREHDLGSRNSKVSAMVFPDPEGVESESVGQDGLFDHLAKHSRLGVGRAVRL